MKPSQTSAQTSFWSTGVAVWRKETRSAFNLSLIHISEPTRPY